MQPIISSSAGLMHGTKPLHQTVPGKIALSIAATLFVAACAHVSIPLFFTPVPITLQTFAVILVGMALGPVAGTAGGSRGPAGETAHRHTGREAP